MEYPGIKKRIAAFGLDYVVISAYLILLGALATSLSFLFDTNPLLEFASSPLKADLLAFATAVLPVLLYFALQEGSAKSATWGKRRMGIRVVNKKGDQLGIGASFLRTAIKLLPWQVAHTCLFHIPGWPLEPLLPPDWVIGGLILVWVLVGLFFLSAAMSKDGRSIYDRISRSTVVMVTR